ncbi:MAG: glutathione-regulated potassium-efflux system protein KefC, partial [Thiohalomonadales bacterium]
KLYFQQTHHLGDDMDDQGLLFNAMVYLLAAVLAVPVSKYFGFGSVLGYLLAGIVIGPWGVGLVHNAEHILHFAEFGVVLLLFAIGLELQPSRLWALRKPILWLGIGQVILTTLLFFVIGKVLAMSTAISLVAAMGLSLSSTAMALQMFNEKNLLQSEVGQGGFSVLLFQDIAVIPMLAAIPLLSVSDNSAASEFDWMALGQAFSVILLIIIGGRYALRPILRLVAATQLREIFTAFTLLLVIATGLLMQAVGMSMALGAFLSGVLLAESEYRHALESDIEPFKGLLLGLFFIAVGMSIDFGILFKDPVIITAMALGLVLFKSIVLYLLGRVYGLPSSQLPLFALVLSQGGEFAFVLFGVAQTSGVLPELVTDTLIVTVALSMMTTPILMLLHDKFLVHRFERDSSAEAEEIEDHGHQVIIAGFGRFGQIVGRLLHANGIGATVLEHDPNHIETLRKFQFKVFYGDAGRLDLLRTAGAERAKVLVIAIDDRDAVLRLAELAKHEFPDLKIVTRAWDLTHVFELLETGVELVERETFEAALKLGETTLQQLGFSAWRAKQAAHHFRAHDEKTLQEIYRNYHQDMDVRIGIASSARQSLRDLMQSDEQFIDTHVDKDWKKDSDTETKDVPKIEQIS